MLGMELNSQPRLSSSSRLRTFLEEGSVSVTKPVRSVRRKGRIFVLSFGTFLFCFEKLTESYKFTSNIGNIYIG
ncbi:hypothetical protein GWI33_022628 [Rhynchophorus ferrugineus]|uniref:Uncharacterized protein n=1 Tax=Rhynchophorus ferrugineus TaxID=354439 RepID=A0A834ISB0_RHYFE|nr:hypothetical protein GWI33_022628 [Rhynchophorus ferrugineus]